MLSAVRRRLTYANVGVTLLLFIALGGGAYAVTLAPRNSVVSKSIKNGQVKGRDVKESSLGTVPSAQPAAFARVSETGDVSHAKAIPDNVTVSGGDIYCFRGLKFQPRGGQVTTDYTDNAVSDPIPEVGLGAAGGCPGGTQAFVWLHHTNGLGAPSPFFVVFYR